MIDYILENRNAVLVALEVKIANVRTAGGAGTGGRSGSI